MTILEALTWGEKELKTTSVEKTTRSNEKLDAQVLLSHCLEKPTSYLFTHFEDRLPANVLEKYERAIERRKRHEPVAYITGEKPFYKRSFFVNQFTLIPRPETEHLVDLVKEKAKDGSIVVEVGTGSGAISVTLAAELGIPIIATEIDGDTLSVAKHNARTHKVDHMISFLQGNLLQPYLEKNVNESSADHAVIVANLPYVPLGRWDLLDPDVRKYEPKGAITSGVDGLNLYDEFLQQISTYRNRFPKKTEICMEMDSSQELTLPRLVKEHFPESKIEVLYDLANKPRITSALV